MPIVELANHGSERTYSAATSHGVAIGGVFSGEVLVKYADFDPHGVFMIWGFAAEQPQAFSIALGGKVGQRPVQIYRELGNLQPSAQFWVPGFSVTDGAGKLQFLMIGSRRYPGYCKGIFYKLMQAAGFTGFEEAFDTIQHLNRTHFLNLLGLLEDVDGQMARMLRRMTRFQLQALSYCYGARSP